MSYSTTNSTYRTSTDLASSSERAALSERLRPWFVGVLAIGVLARCVRYLGGWPLWGDETSLATNIAQRDFLGLLAPLDLNQIAPAGYLLTVKSLVVVFGFNEYSLRFVAFAASLCTLWVVYELGRRCSSGWGAWLPVALVAVTEPQIRHSAELKQYALETLVTGVLALFALSVHRGSRRSALGLLFVTPLSLLFSMPAAFVGGGIVLSTLPHVVSRRSVAWWAWYAGYGVVLLGSFGLVYVLLLAPPMATMGHFMDGAWSHAFPNVDSIGGLVLWVLETATGVLFTIPVGGEHGASIVTAAAFAIGLRRLWRDGNRDFVRLVVATMSVALLAAFLRKYPFGGHGRVVQYLVPLQCVPIAAGIVEVVERVRRRRLARPGESGRLADAFPSLRLVCVLLLVVGLGITLKDVVRPYHGTSAREKHNFARWFWRDYRKTGELRCASDAWRDEFTETREPRHYECFREMYAPNVRQLDRAVPETLEGRVGLVVSTTLPQDDVEPLAEWERRLAERYHVVSHERFPVNSSVPFPRAEEFHVLWVEPRTEPTDSPVRAASFERDAERR